MHRIMGRFTIWCRGFAVSEYTACAAREQSSSQLEWVRRMNSIRSRAEEIVLRELVYC